MAAEIEYGWARTADGLCIAYEVHGDAEVALVLVPGILNTLMAPVVSRRLAVLDEEMCAFARLVKLDKRGTGLSDPIAAGTTPTVEERIDDVRAVMDEIGLERACVLGTADGGAVAMVFAATYPERVSALILESTGPRITWAPDWPFGNTDERRDAISQQILARWGTGIMADVFGTPSDERRREYVLLERLAGTPTSVADALRATRETDVRDALSSITAPTLVVHNADHPLWPIEGARYLAAHIEGARLIELAPLAPDATLGDRDVWIPALEELVTGSSARRPIDRVLKTVLFTDIVGSTQQAARVGDRRWRTLLDEHDAGVREAIAAYAGEEINTTGDGFLAAFDGPARAIRSAQAVVGSARALGMHVRVGIHTGECERRGDDLAGIAVHIGARVAALADGDEVLVTGTVRDLVAGSGIEFHDRGLQELKGVPGRWQVLAVSDGSRPAPA